MGQAGVRWCVLFFLALAGLGCFEAPAFARQRMSFQPGRHNYEQTSFRRPRHRIRSGRHHGRAAVSRRGHAASPAEPARVPPGFKMEDGVLTYPAPARFQPQNLKRR